MRFLIPTIAILLCCCEKHIVKPEDARLPFKTKLGRGIFACRFDQQTHITKRQKINASYNAGTGYLFIHNINPEKHFEFRLFVYDSVFSAGTYNIDSTGEEYLLFNGFDTYGINPEGVNELNVDFLSTKKEIVSGTFQMDLINEEGDLIEVRDGIYDLKIDVYE